MSDLPLFFSKHLFTKVSKEEWKEKNALETKGSDAFFVLHSLNSIKDGSR